MLITLSEEAKMLAASAELNYQIIDETLRNDFCLVQQAAVESSMEPAEYSHVLLQISRARDELARSRMREKDKNE